MSHLNVRNVFWRAHGVHTGFGRLGDTPSSRSSRRGRKLSGTTCCPGEILPPGGFIVSTDGRFALVYQGDGNLVAYRNSDGAAIWSSQTHGTAPGATARQDDGNLVVYDRNGTAVFSSGTSGQHGNQLVMQDDENVVLYRPDGSVTWASNSVDWSAVPYSRFETPDGDMIETFVEHGSGAGDVVEFVLQLGGAVTWREVLNMPDGQRSAWDIVAEGRDGSGRNSLWAHQVTNGQRLTLSKAKFLGTMSAVHTLGALANLVGGDRVTVKWIKD